jgi:hypothetical protein
MSQVLQDGGVMLLMKCLAARCNECCMHLSVKLDVFGQKYEVTQVLTTCHVL